MTLLERNLDSIKNLQPIDVFRYFAEISSIPRGSGNTNQIVEYLVNFAVINNLKYEKDDYNNVIITKESRLQTKGAIALQAHIDMVCVKSDECAKDLTKEGVDLIVDGDFLKANKTSLGADDGIGMAIILAVLSDKNDCHRNIIGIFTSDEERGMVGANHLDFKKVNSKLFVNLDSERYGEVVLGCSSGYHITINKKYNYENIENASYVFDIGLSGGLGGHSAIEITKCRLNANVMLARILYELSHEVNIYLININGGTFDNIIPSKCTATVAIGHNDEDRTIAFLESCNTMLKREYENSDEGIELNYKKIDATNNYLALSEEDADNLLKMLYIMPNGLLDVMLDFPDVADTSLNLGTIALNVEGCSISYMVRSAIMTKCSYISNKVIEIAKLFGFEVGDKNSYPEWKYKKKSHLRDKIEELSVRINNDKMVPKVTHGGLECGILLSNAEEIDAISIGPTIDGAHSINEKLTIPTVNKIYKILVQLINEI